MGSDELITEAEIYDAPEWAWDLANDIVHGNQGCGNAAVLIHRAFTAQLAEAREAERAAVVAWLRNRDEPGAEYLATWIEAGDHRK